MIHPTAKEVENDMKKAVSKVFYGGLNTDRPKSFTYVKLNGGKYTQADLNLIAEFKKDLPSSK